MDLLTEGTEGQTMGTKINLHQLYQMNYLFFISKIFHTGQKSKILQKKRQTHFPLKSVSIHLERGEQKLKFISADRTKQVLLCEHFSGLVPCLDSLQKHKSKSHSENHGDKLFLFLFLLSF